MVDNEEMTEEHENVIAFPVERRRAMIRKAAVVANAQREVAEDAPRRKAQDLAWDAFDTLSKTKKRQLAKLALGIYPDCADAYVILAGLEPNPEKALGIYEKGVEAGRRDLGEERFAADAGHFWGILDTRPYMRSVQGRGLTLKTLGRLAEAAECFAQLLRLNPNDNQGVRWELLPVLLELGRDADAKELSDRFEGDVFASMTYGRALLLFRLEGDSRGARAALSFAVKANRKVVRYLTGQRKPPRKRYEYFSHGDHREAAIAALDLIPAWRATPGAIDWLIERTTPRPRKKT